MNESRLRSLLREAPVPAGEDAERRGLAVVEEAFAQRRQPQRQALPRLALIFAIAALLGALMLSPAGAEVRGWIDDVFTAGVPDAEQGLTDIPGGGRLLVQTPAGPWVVQSDGSRRLLGDYGGATWSPHGLFVAATSGHTLSAIEPDGTPRWSLSATGPASDPRWSPSGFRIAYRAGGSLRVARADGSADALLDPGAAPVAPVWSPQGLDALAYVDRERNLRIAGPDSREMLASGKALPGIATLDWARDGSTLLEASRRSLRLHRVTAGKLAAGLNLGPPQDVRLPAGAVIQTAAFSPAGVKIAVLLEIAGRPGHPGRSEVLLIDPGGGPERRLFSVPGRLADLAWSPDGHRLLIAWPDADQWLFIPAGGLSRARAIGGVAGEFAPGGEPTAVAFPRVDGWCCAATVNPSSP